MARQQTDFLLLETAVGSHDRAFQINQEAWFIGALQTADFGV